VLPSEFFNTFGPVRTYTLTVPTPGGGRLPPDPFRYLLAFWSWSGDMTIIPDGDLALATFGWTKTGGGDPVIFTHALHGALVGSGWLVTGAAIPTFSVGIVEGRMTKRKRKGM
jgi:hypothetical protein